MTKSPAGSHTPTPTERAVAYGDALLGGALLALGVLALVVAASAIIGTRLSGEPLHPDAVLFPIIAAVPLLGLGGLLWAAGRAVRRGTSGRWELQAAAVTLLLILAYALAF